MKKPPTLIVAMVVLIASCAAPSPTGSTGSSSASMPLSGSASMPLSGSASASVPVSSSADRDKFVGTWTGTYGCVGVSIKDTLTISRGSGERDLSIKIHATTSNSDTVSGELTGPNEVKVSEQSMGGAPGTAEITLQGEKLTYRQTGLGITCSGTDYARAP
jgi:hypothetical protein